MRVPEDKGRSGVPPLVDGLSDGDVASTFSHWEKDFLNVRLTALSDTLRTWRSGPQGSLEKIFKFFQKGG
jgi:hypothetical protein